MCPCPKTFGLPAASTRINPVTKTVIVTFGSVSTEPFIGPVIEIAGDCAGGLTLTTAAETGPEVEDVMVG